MDKETLERYRKYLTNAQIKELAAKAERYKLLNAQRRSEAQSSLLAQQRQARRGLQNMGLASRKGKLISGLETARNDALTNAYDTYDRQLRKVEEAQTQTTAARMVNANIEAQRRAAEEAYQRQVAEQARQRSEYNEQMLDPRLSMPKPSLSMPKPNQLPKPRYNPDVMTDPRLQPMSAPEKAQDAVYHRYENAVAQKLEIEDLRKWVNEYGTPSARDSIGRRKIADAKRKIEVYDSQHRYDELPLWSNDIMQGNQVGKPTTRTEYSTYQKAEQSRKKYASAFAADTRAELYSMAPESVKPLIELDDADFELRYKAAEQAYKNAYEHNRVNEIQKWGTNGPTSYDAYANDALRQATELFAPYQKAKAYRDSIKSYEQYAYWFTFEDGTPSAKYDSKWTKEKGSKSLPIDRDDSGKSIYDEGRRYGDTRYGFDTSHTMQAESRQRTDRALRFRTLENRGYDAAEYDRTHGTGDSKYSALVNEYSILNGDATADYNIKTQKMSEIAGANEFFSGIYKAKGITGKEKDEYRASVFLAHFMTDEERALFNTIYDKYGADKADEYFEFLRNDYLSARAMDSVNEIYEHMSEGSGIDSVWLSIYSVPVNLYQGAVGVFDTLINGGNDKVTEQLRSMKWNGAQQIRSSITQRMYNDKYRSLLAEGKAPEQAKAEAEKWFNEGGGKWASFGYNTGMSVADSMTVALITKGIGTTFQGIGISAKIATRLASALGGSLLGASAFNATYQESLNRGLNPDKARLTALGSGVNEMLFEALSIGTLLEKTGHATVTATRSRFVNGVVNILIQGGVEGSEEVFTSIANNLWDKLVNKYRSEYDTKIREYVANGMTYDEAKKEADMEFGESLWLDFLGGLASGIGMSGGSQMLDTVVNREYYKQSRELARIGRQFTEQQVQDLKSFEYKSQEAQELAQKGKLTNDEIAVLASTRVQEVAELQQRYNQYGLKLDENGQVLNENGLTAEEYKLLKDNESVFTETQLTAAGLGKIAPELAKNESAMRAADRTYRETVAEINEDASLTIEQKQQKTAEAKQTRANAQSEAAGALDRTWNKHGLAVLKAETDDSGVHYVRTGKGSGKVTFDFSTYNDGKSENHNTVETMTEREKAALRIAQVVASRGVNVKVESEFTGEHRNENGYYDRETQTIHVNLSGTYSVLWTVSHELTHHLANVNKQAYNDLRDAIRAELQKSELTTSELEQQGFDYQVADVDEYIVKTGNLWDALVQYEAEKRGYGEEAEEEVIARCCESFLANDVFIQSFAKKHFKSAKAISSFLTQMDADMNQIFTDAEIRVKMNGIRTDVSPEQQILSQVANVQEIAQKWARAVNALEKKRAAKSDGVRASRIDKQIVKISDDSDLARLIRETRDKPSKVIAQYILSVFGGQSIRMSDGREVIVDTHDAKKLSQYPKPRKTAELSSIRKIIETATLDHSATSPRHNKYKEFYYYLGDVEYNGKVYTVELNIGVTKNDGLSHLYDVRDWNKNGTADQSKTGTSMPGNAGVSITSDSTINNIPSRTDYVKHSDKESLSIVQDDDVRYSKMDGAKAGSLSGQEYLKYLQLGKKVVNKTATAEEIREFKKKMNSLSQDNREAFLDRLREKRIRDDEGSKVREQRLKRDLRITALKWNQRLVKMLANPTEASHIPVQLAQEVAEFTKALTEYMDGGTERGRLNLDKIMIAYQRAFDNQITIEEAQRENPNYDPRGSVIDGEMYDEQLEQMINDLNAVLQSKSIEELNSFELNELLNIVRGVTYTVYEANRMIGTSERKAIWEVGDKMVSELETAPKVSGRWYLEKSLDLRRMAKIFSGSNEKAEFVKLVDQLNEGAIEKERVAQALQSIFTPVTERYGDEIRNWYGKNAEWIDTGIKKGDKKIEITKGMRVSLALHVLNAGNMRHIQRGGLTIPNRELYRKGKLQDAYANGELVRLKAEQINEIISHMTEAEKAYVEAAKNLFHKRTGYYVNRTSLKLLGYRKAIVENYFPIHTNKNFTKTDFASLKMDGSIEGQGFLKERAGSSNPVYLEDITSVVNRQIRGVALYAGLAIPMRNFNAVMNASIYEDDNGVWSPKTTVKEVLTKKMGAYGAKVVEGFLTDVSEMSHVDVTPFAGKLATNYVKAVLLGNLKVAMKQVASYPTAAAVIPWKYLGKAFIKGGRNHRLISRADVDLINQYTPLYQMRREGQANEIASIMAKRGLEQKLPWLLGWITKMDVMTVGRLWSAAEYMVADQQKNLPVGSDAYYKSVAKVFNDTVQQTQPNFTPLQRNAVLRSKNPIERSLVLFGTQRMQNGGILIEALYELKHSKGKSESEIRAAKQKLGRAVASQVVQNILLIVASLGVDALRGRMKSWQDDDKEITVESLAKGMGDMFLSNFVGSFLGGSEVYDLISTVYKKATGSPAYGANFTIPAIDALEYLYDTVGNVVEFINYVNEGHSVEEKLKKAKSLSYDLAKAFGYATGIPLENAVKDLFKGIIPAIQDLSDWKKTGELIPWLHQSGKLDQKKTSERYKEWTNLGKSGREFFYWDNKMKDITKRDDRIAMLANENIPNEEKAMLVAMFDTSGAYAEGTKVFRSNGKEYYDFANAEPISPIESTLNEIEEATAAPTAEPTATPNPLSEAKQEGVQQAVAQGVPEQTANEAFLTYQNMGKNHDDGYSKNDDFRAWLFTNVTDSHQRAVLEYQVIGQASKVEGSVTYRESGVVYRDYTNEAWFKLSEHNLAKDGTNKRYEAGKQLEKTGLSIDKTVAIYDGLKDLTKKAEWTEYLKKQGLTDEQINIFLWSRGWAK